MVHKVQKITMGKVVISFDLLRQRSFNYGQMYVAMSRVTSLNRLYLIGKFNLSAVKAVSRTIHEYQRMGNNNQLLPITVPYISHKSLTLFF